MRLFSYDIIGTMIDTFFFFLMMRVRRAPLCDMRTYTAKPSIVWTTNDTIDTVQKFLLRYVILLGCAYNDCPNVSPAPPPPFATVPNPRVPANSRCLSRGGGGDDDDVGGGCFCYTRPRAPVHTGTPAACTSER